MGGGLSSFTVLPPSVLGHPRTSLAKLTRYPLLVTFGRSQVDLVPPRRDSRHPYLPLAAQQHYCPTLW